MGIVGEEAEQTPSHIAHCEVARKDEFDITHLYSILITRYGEL